MDSSASGLSDKSLNSLSNFNRSAPTTVDRNKYYCVDVVMKHGFQYTMYLRGHAVSSMKKFAENLYWTKSVTLRDSSEEEHNRSIEEASKKLKKEIGFSSLENFFEEKPKRKKKSNG